MVDKGAELVWKEKYLNSLSLIERLEESGKNYTEQLKRCMVRVSLASEGIDPELDSIMGLLRASLKKELSIPELEVLGQKIESTVLAWDKKKSQYQQQTQQQFEVLVEQLLGLDPPHKIKNDIKHFQKKIIPQLDEIYAHSAILESFAELQAKALQAMQPDQKDNKKPGLLKSLFGLSMEDKGNQEQQLGIIDTEHKKVMAPAGNFSLAKDLSSSNNGSVLSDESSTDAIRERLSSIFLTMLDLIYVPVSHHAQQEQIRERISQGLRWPEVPDTLSVLVSLVAESTNFIQKDTEIFLQSLNTRLCEIQDFLTENQQRTLQKESNSQQLGESVKNHIADINDRLNRSHDIGDLKGSIELHLKHIMEDIDFFKKQEQKLDTDTMESVKTLTQRIESLETEARMIRATYMEHKEKAYVDALTQLPNRLAYEKRSAQEYARWQRYSNALSMAVCDLDFFKKINDSYGHAAGDKVLSKVGELFNKTLRSTDFSCRFGGEEFVILLPETNVDAAKRAMEKVRMRIEESPFHFRGERVQVTISIGISEFATGDTLEQVFERADQAMYEAKHQGRNCVQIKSLPLKP